MDTEKLIEKHLFGKKPEKWDDEFDRIQHLSVNDIRALLDEHAKYVLSAINGSFTSKFQEIIYSDLSDSEIVNALHKLDNDR